MLVDELLELLFLFEHWTARDLLFLALFILHLDVFALGHLFSAQHVLPADLAILYIFIVASLVSCVVDAYQAAADLGTTDVVHCQVARTLILVLEPAEAFAFA